MFKPHDYAQQIEATLKALFKRDRFEIGGIVDANFIERNPFIAIAFALGNFYNKADATFKQRIDEFFEVNYSEMGKSMKEIEEEKLKRIVEEFKDIVATI